MRNFYCVLLSLLCVSCSSLNNSADELLKLPDDEPIIKYGLEIENFNSQTNKVKQGDSFGALMSKFGVEANNVDKLIKVAQKNLDLSKLKVGNTYEVLYDNDSLSRAAYFIYEIDNTKWFLLSLKDSLYSKVVDKQISKVRKLATVNINTSLWNDVQRAGIPVVLALKLSDIYDCTIDFFGLQKGDYFTVLYDELEHKGEFIGLSNIYYVEFFHDGAIYKAVRFKEGDKSSQFWNEKGESLKKAFLKAPLNFTRISSTFTYARKHPVLKIVRPHTGVDYAAPSGTPVVALGDGQVIFKGWTNGGGNTLKIKHNSTYTTSYMHLKGFAKGISKGSRVKQGELIAYVGSTGISTGPHLDFRVYKNGSPINPLKMESPSVEPVSKKYMSEFESAIKNYVSQVDSINASGYLDNYINILK